MRDKVVDQGLIKSMPVATCPKKESAQNKESASSYRLSQLRDKAKKQAHGTLGTAREIHDDAIRTMNDWADLPKKATKRA